MYHGAVGVEFLRSMAAVIGELLDQVFIALAKLVLRAVGQRQTLGGKVLQQILQQTIRQAVFVRPRAVAEDAGHLIAVGLFNLTEGLHNRRADILRHLTDVIPVVALRHKEGVQLLLGIEFHVLTVFFDGYGGLFIVNIADALEEHQRENVLLVGTRIDVGAQQHGALPEIAFQLVNRNPLSHRCILPHGAASSVPPRCHEPPAGPP